MLLFAVPVDRGLRSDAVLRGVAGAGILLFYPEVAMFAVAGVVLVFALALFRRHVPAGKSLESLGITLGVATLINPVTAYYAVYSLISHSKGRSGFDVALPLAKLLRSLVGYEDPILLDNFVSTLGIVLGTLALAILIWGVKQMLQIDRDRWIGVSLFFLVIGVYTLLVANYSYAAYKTLCYSYFLVAVAIGFGWGHLWRQFSGSRGALACLCGVALIWAVGITIPLRRYLTTHYNMAGQLIHSHPKGFRGFAQDYEDLTSLAKLPGPGEETLVFIPNNPVERWATYNYRAPVSLYFHSGLPLLRPMVMPRQFNQKYVLAEVASTALKNPKAAIFTNNRFVFSKAQPAISLTNTGWYPEELVAGESRRWMAHRAELVAWVPEADKIRLLANVNPASPQTKTVVISVDGKRVGECKLAIVNPVFDSGELDLAAGFHTIQLEVLETKASPTGADPRELSLLWGRIRFSEPTPTEIIINDAPLDSQIRGLTADRWMTDKTVAFTLAVSNSASRSLRVLGDVPGLDALFPQTITATFPGGARGTASITKAGDFDVLIPIPAGVSGDTVISLNALKTVNPSLISANPDNRRLALRFKGVQIK